MGDPAVSGTVVSKARAGDVISLYATGMATSLGGIIPTAFNVPTGVTVTLTSTTNSGLSANAIVGYAGLAAVGEFQINITVPTLPAGNYSVVVTTAGQSSQGGVIIPIQ